MKRQLLRASGTAVGAVLALLVAAESVSASQDYPTSTPGRSPSTPTSSSPTPRTADGKPDISGVWRSINPMDITRPSSGRGSYIVGENGRALRTESDGDSFSTFPSRRCAPNQQGCRDNTNQANDYELTFRDEPNRPLYRAEHWDKVQFLDYDTNFSDPLFRCVPYGVPRVGAPRAIMPVPNGFIFLYTARNHDYRLIPTDGRGHNPDHLPGYWGNAVGRWEGDTLVVETTGFNDTTWIASGIEGGGGGYFHSFGMRVIERFRRDGGSIHYQVTVEDPEVLLEPWALDSQTLVPNTAPDVLFGMTEGTPCENIDEAIAVNRIRH